MGFLTRSVVILGLCAALTAKAAAPQKALFVVFGGYGSCGKSDHATVPAAGVPIAYSFKTLHRQLATRGAALDVTTLFGCLHSDAPPEGLVEYVLSTSPTKSLDGDTKDVRADIEAFLKKNPDAYVYLIGHSYGGWMSMYLAETLAGKPKIKGLFTLDPIGPACGALGLVFGDSACHSAPTDRDNKAIAARVGVWENFYQTEDTWLTSSDIPEASKNHHITFSWGPHSEMDTDDGIWDYISKVVQKTF